METYGKISRYLKEVKMTIYGVRMDGSSNDTHQAKIRRAVLGAFYGLLAGIAFVFVAAFIDIWLHPELPLGVNWEQFWARLPLFTFGLALVGAVTSWWNEAWPGLVSGAAVAAAYALIVALVSSSGVEIGTKLLVLLFILVPVAAMVVPVSWTMRWLVERHARALDLNLSYVRIGGLVLLTLLLGAAGGYFMKMSARQLQATQQVHQFLQNPDTAENIVNKVDGIAEHQGMTYTLYARVSETSTEGFDIRAVFDDGYVLKCTAVLYPGRPAYLSSCIAE